MASTSGDATPPSPKTARLMAEMIKLGEQMKRMSYEDEERIERMRKENEESLGRIHKTPNWFLSLLKLKIGSTNQSFIIEFVVVVMVGVAVATTEYCSSESRELIRIGKSISPIGPCKNRTCSCLGERQDYVSEDMVVPHAAALDNFLQDLARAMDSFVRVVSIHFDSEFDAIILQAKKFFENFHNSLRNCSNNNNNNNNVANTSTNNNDNNEQNQAKPSSRVNNEMVMGVSQPNNEPINKTTCFGSEGVAKDRLVFGILKHGHGNEGSNSHFKAFKVSDLELRRGGTTEGSKKGYYEYQNPQ
ncbi:hypothetical protein JHK84_028215 [Glycine max]|nr:hypothetical protein JHK84_028215 [Glycine max]